jgi:low affinity Fe/Cu permease
MKKNSFARWFDKFCSRVTHITGSSSAFMIALGVIIVWGVTGPLFNYSDTWQLVINTGTTIVTFLMVFVIQQSQNKDSVAVQIKLNELIAATTHASDHLISVEDLTEEELLVIQKHYQKLAELTKKKASIQKTHSVEEAIRRVEEKFQLKGK